MRVTPSRIFRAILSWLWRRSSTLPCAHPRQITSVRPGIDDVEHERACLVVDDPGAAALVVAVAMFAVYTVDVDALIDARVIVNQQIRRPRCRPLESFGGQLLFDGALNVVLEERILVESRIAGRQGVSRTPVIGAILREVEAALDMRAHVERRAARCGERQRRTAVNRKSRRIGISLRANVSPVPGTLSRPAQIVRATGMPSDAPRGSRTDVKGFEGRWR